MALTGRIKIRKDDLIAVIEKAKEEYLVKHSQQETARFEQWQKQRAKAIQDMKKVVAAINKDIKLAEAGKDTKHLDALRIRWYDFNMLQGYRAFEPNTQMYDQDLHLLELSVDDTIAIGVTSQFAKYF